MLLSDKVETNIDQGCRNLGNVKLVVKHKFNKCYTRIKRHKSVVTSPGRGLAPNVFPVRSKSRFGIGITCSVTLSTVQKCLIEKVKASS